MLDVHLMIERPERHVGEFVKAGADSITFHAEATPHVAYTANLIREQRRVRRRGDQPRARPSARWPRWPAAIDLALCMTVNPGWGGQPFIEHSLEKIAARRARSSARTWRSRSTAASTPRPRPRAAQAGASLFVAGSAIFGRGDPGEAYRAIARAVGAD